MKLKLCLTAAAFFLLCVSYARGPKKVKMDNFMCRADYRGCRYALVYKNDSGVRLDFYDCLGRLLVTRHYLAGLRPKKDWLCEDRGSMHGEEIIYDSTGRVTAKRMHRYGWLSGETFTYHPNGKTASAGMHSDGKKHGVFRYYDTAGHLVHENHYKKGERYEGYWSDAHPNGFTHVSLYKHQKLKHTAVLKQNGDTSSVYHFRWDRSDRMVEVMDVYKDNRFAYKRPFAANYRDSFFMGNKTDSNKVKPSDTVNNRDISFIGGESAMMAWLQENLEYPSSAQEAGRSGIVEVNILFGKEGIMLDVFSRSEVHTDLVREALRVIKSMDGLWLHARHQGTPVMVMAKIPITFQLN